MSKIFDFLGNHALAGDLGYKQGILRRSRSPPMDTPTLQALIDSHGAALQLLARQWCDAPEDAVQEALIELLQQQPVPRTPAAWLYTVVRRRAMNLARAESRRRKHQRDAGLARSAWFVPDSTAEDTTAECQTALAGLPRQEREIVILRIWGEQTFAQIADVVQLPLSTVHRRYHTALASLESSLLCPQTSRPES
ncbi:RNA polymerase sigma factor [Roseimaritima ulvae]|uniref:RNA polymerase sigma factor n=1 Tax=Roseimaritima ulvae TaxID=980254 RepID=UPI0013902922|nr:RNA polymerase sigma factor [Roseimaritima ulvae]